MLHTLGRSQPSKNTLCQCTPPQIEPVTMPLMFQHSFKYRGGVPDLTDCVAAWDLHDREQSVVKGEPAPTPLSLSVLFQILHPSCKTFPTFGESSCCKLAPDRHRTPTTSVEAWSRIFSFRLPEP